MKTRRPTYYTQNQWEGHNTTKKERKISEKDKNNRRKKNQEEEYNKDNFKKEEGRNSVKETSENHIMYKNEQ